jgi:molybdopterin converting factor small subunit
MKVLIPGPLLPYTKKRHVEASGASIAQMLADLERQFPGISFRMVDEQGKIRRHMRFFIDGEQVFDLDRPLGPDDYVQIVQALSGG